MIIKNEFVKIKTDKEIVLHNYLYDEYLEAFCKSQYVTSARELEELNMKKSFELVYIKFEDKLVDFQKAKPTDFDIKLDVKIVQKETNTKSINAYYTYSMKASDIEKYMNKKITAIGFGTYGKILACIDTSNYSVFVTKDERMEIVRKDTFSSDAECIGYDYPIHLSPQSLFTKTRSLEPKEFLSILYSVGFGTSKGDMQEEYILEEDIHNQRLNIEYLNDTTFEINLKRDTYKNVFPNTNFYGATGKMPVAFYDERDLFPESKLYGGTNKYPVKSNYQYIILKYQLYYIDYSMSAEPDMTRINKFYTMNIPLNNIKGLFKLRTKVERR